MPPEEKIKIEVEVDVASTDHDCARSAGVWSVQTMDLKKFKDVVEIHSSSNREEVLMKSGDLILVELFLTEDEFYSLEPVDPPYYPGDTKYALWKGQ